MFDAKKFHDLLKFVTKKDVGEWFSYEQLDTLLERASMSLFKELIGDYQKTQQLSDMLSPFVKIWPYSSSPSGMIEFAEDYEMITGINIEYYDPEIKKTITYPVTLLRADELSDRLSSQILKPSLSAPVMTSAGFGRFQLYPGTGFHGTAIYLRTPAVAKTVYTIDGRKINYDAAGSVHIEWPNQAINKLLVKTAQLAGVNVDDNMLIQYTETKDREDI